MVGVLSSRFRLLITIPSTTSMATTPRTTTASTATPIPAKPPADHRLLPEDELLSPNPGLGEFTIDMAVIADCVGCTDKSSDAVVVAADCVGCTDKSSDAVLVADCMGCTDKPFDAVICELTIVSVVADRMGYTDKDLILMLRT